MYSGSWKYNKLNGEGVMKYPNGNEYSGSWKESYKNGKGVFTFTNGDKYSGSYENSETNGQGIYTRVESSTFTERGENETLALIKNALRNLKFFLSGEFLSMKLSKKNISLHKYFP